MPASLSLASANRAARSTERASTPNSLRITKLELPITPPPSDDDQYVRVTRSMIKSKVSGPSAIPRLSARREGSNEMRPTRRARASTARPTKDISTQAKELETYKKMIERAIAVRDSALECVSCHLPSRKPYTLQGCGHSYCLGCIRTAFNKCLEHQLEDRNAPAKLHQPFTAYKLKELLRLKYIFVPLYFCPKCGDCQTEKPKRNHSLLDLTAGLADIFGEPAVTAEERTPPPKGNKIWDGVYVDNEDSDDGE
ncbi:hypothetical protein BV22DRAFT_1133413 [Leucogyrophana mollusca]|uniref:Uncharacterized protein n=1 Tax=Leucogyrophana mollusca TaxID=85980 RepID=A0ACB8B586_9AGAM|nr:hypothetical protein BV22DRAFT_1133413 [Leucogyrophana mollusca]